MYPNPPPITIPTSYEALPTTHIKVAHHPAGSPTATPVVIVSLNRPEKHNAFTQIMAENLEKVFGMFDLDERVKAVVLTGAGNAFCAGADLEIGFGGGRERVRTTDHRDSGGRVALAIHRCRKPTIAAMQGSAVGVGMTMTLPAAIRIAHASSKYGFVFARRGIFMESCSSYFLPRLIGYSRAMYLVSTGGVFPSTSKHFDGLFAETLPDKSRVLPRALELATDIAENVSPMASALNRALMWRCSDSAEEAHLLESGILYHMFGALNQKEGVSAFFEKRKPNFQATLEQDGPANYPWWSEVNIDPPVKPLKEPSKL
ncbi:enoyl-CoA hydratase/isomerase family protein [Aspergillus clavatus NRRL 1]|uniref:Enoyl-CoA hydratase/isomerase family protein n=1 Tax=Aspergillus clavatus (strain ATCC 1007 / CBS 513.65 / DSM 816 / NCTC 3887 / NRRL 1 / QM 1276 / 107) TaxID=344612 RepID=A1CSA6_ASPCL|nr:enoyl-CoA hydratase/isomerase family protein [Aspergillus clavatus NRRL 1]EAW08527.1 enoyl-CoA hydratase/isomerase family protein [Aspergillus clavatus NRRL 1]